MGLTGDEMNAVEIEESELVARLFSYIAEAQRLKALATPPASELIEAGRGFWLADLPNHEAIHDTRNEADGPILTVEHRAKQPVPDMADDLKPWLEPPYDRPGWEPRVRSEYLYGETVNEDREEVRLARLSDSPETATEIDAWLEEWRSWALEDIRNAPIRKLYRLLEHLRVSQQDQPDDFEIVFQAGYLALTDGQEPAAGRHLVRVPVSIIKNESDDLEVSTAGAPVFDVAPIDASILPATENILQTKSEVAETDGRPSDPATLSSYLSAFARGLNPELEFVDQDERTATDQSSDENQNQSQSLHWAPAIVLRPVHPQSNPLAPARVAELIRLNGNPPEVLSPTYQPAAESDSEPDGLFVEVRGRVLTPPDLTPPQLNYLFRAGEDGPTVVLTRHSNRDGGQTETSGVSTALALQHLAALGRRVLVTGPDSERLKTIANELPEPVSSLAAIATGEAELDDVAESVSRSISEFGGKTSVADKVQEEADLIAEIELLVDQLAEQEQEFLDLDVIESTQHEVHDVVGTIGQISQWHDESTSKYDWLDISREASLRPCPISNGDFERWLRLMRNQVSPEDLEQIAVPDPMAGLEGIPSPEEFSNLLEVTADPIPPSVTTTLDDTIVDMDSGERRDLIAELHRAIETIRETELSSEITDGVLDVSGDEFNGWTVRQGQIAAALGRVHATHLKWSHLPVVLSMDLEEATNCARELLEHLEKGRPIRLNEDGSPKVALGSPKVIKKNAEFFSHVSVGDKPAVDAEQLTAFLEGATAWRLLDEVDAGWPEGTPVPAGATISERLNWHDLELARLNKILDAAKRLDRRYKNLYSRGFPTGSAWRKSTDVEPLIRELERVDEVYTQAESHVELSMLASRVDRLTSQTNTRNWAVPLLDAIRERSASGYESALDRRLAMIRWDSQMNWLGDVRSRLRPHAPKLVSAMEADPADPAWDDRALNFHEAWRWSAVGTWLEDNQIPSAEAISRRVDFVEDQLRKTSVQLTEVRTWRHALARMESIPEAQRSAGSVVPIWFGAINEVVDQFELNPNSFDVVVVDGASQLGLESLFVQYLAPKVIVVGNGYPRPSEVNAPRPEGLSELARELLPDSYRDRWVRPELSLFDEYALRFGNLIEIGDLPEADRSKEEPAPDEIVTETDNNNNGVDGDGDDNGDDPEESTIKVHRASDVPEPFESLFEQRVFARLIEEGFHVESQPDSEGYEIDLLIHGDDASLAVEISDDDWPGSSAYLDRIQARHRLELSGWTYHLLPKHSYADDSEVAAADLKRRLTAMNIAPNSEAEARQDEADYAQEPEIQAWAKEMAEIGSAQAAANQLASDAPNDGGSDLDRGASADVDVMVSEVIVKRPLEVPDQPHVIDLTGATGEEVVVEYSEPVPKGSLFADFDPSSLLESIPPSSEEPVQESVILEQAATEPESESESDAEVQSSSGFKARPFAPYIEWKPDSRYAAPSMTRADLITIITEVARAEGPIRVDRLFRLIVRHSSSGRLNRKMVGKLEEALLAAQKGGLVLVEPSIEGSAMDESFVVTPSTKVVARRRGKRKVSEIPPVEVIAALDALDDGSGDTYRKLANKWDLGRLGFEAKRYLKACDELRSKR